MQNQAAEDVAHHQTQAIQNRAIAASIGDVAFNGDRQRRLCNTSSVTFSGVDGAALQVNLDLAGIAASQGSACASGRVGPSHVYPGPNA